MTSNIDETELARLEALAEHYARVVTMDNVSIPHQIIKSVPALVAEVRRLREALNTFIEEDQSRVILVQRQMLDFLSEKVEAWEWLFEVIEYDVYEDHPLSSKWGHDMSDKEREEYMSARETYAHIEKAARGAVNADRE